MRIYYLAVVLLAYQNNVEFTRGFSASESSRQTAVGNLALLPEELPSKRYNKIKRDDDRIRQRFENNFSGNDFSYKKKQKGKGKHSTSTIRSMELVQRIKQLSKKRAYKQIHQIAIDSNLAHSIYTFTAVITSFALSTFDDKSETVMSYYNMMTDKYGIIPNSYTITAVLMSIDGGSDAIKFINDANDCFGVKLDLSIYNAAIKCCSRQRQRNDKYSNMSTNSDANIRANYEYALLFYSNLLEKGFEPDIITFGNLLHVLGVAKQTDLALDVWAEMKKKGIIPDARCYGAILRACAETGNVIQSKSIFDEIPERVINTLHLNSHLACLAHRNVVDIDRSFDLIERFPHLLDQVTLNTILSTCARSQADDNYHRASKVLKEMKEGKYNGIMPDVISYNNVLAACRDPVQCFEVLQEIRLNRKFQRFNYIEPSPVTYTNAIKACGVPITLQRTFEPSEENTTPGNDVDVSFNEEIVQKIYNSALSEKKANYFVRSAYLHCIASFGNTRSIEEKLVSYKNDGILVYNALFRSLSVTGIKSIGRYDRSTRAMKIKLYYKHLKESRVLASDLTYRYLGNAIMSVDEGDQLDLVKYILSNSKGKLPEDFLDNCVRIFLEHENEELAYEAFQRIENPSSPNYNTLLSLLPTESKLCSKILDHIPIVHFIFLNMSTMTSIIEKLQYLRDYEKIDFYLDLMMDNLDPDDIHTGAANKLIYVLSEHNPAKALQVFNMIPQKKINLRTYKNVLLACQRGAKLEGDYLYFESAFSLLRRMEESGFKPTKDALSSVIGACCAVGNWQTAFSILTKYEESQNVYCLNSVLAVCCKAGAWLEALETYEKYKRSIVPNFITYNTLIGVLVTKGKQVELAANIYNEAVNKSIINHWKLVESVEVMDLHHYSTSMAQIAVYSLLNSLLTIHPRWNVEDDLTIIVGLGKDKGRSIIDGTSCVGEKVLDVLKGYQIKASFVPGNNGRIVVASEDLANFVSRIKETLI